MLNKESEDGKEYFRKLSRKELQSLCKQCSLPARKSTSEMVESLAFYFMVIILWGISISVINLLNL